MYNGQNSTPLSLHCSSLFVFPRGPCTTFIFPCLPPWLKTPIPHAVSHPHQPGHRHVASEPMAKAGHTSWVRPVCPFVQGSHSSLAPSPPTKLQKIFVGFLPLRQTFLSWVTLGQGVQKLSAVGRWVAAMWLRNGGEREPTDREKSENPLSGELCNSIDKVRVCQKNW